jgi:nitrous oxidase accessory protein NosD
VLRISLNFTLALLALLALAGAAQRRPAPGMVLTRNTGFAAGTYTLPSASTAEPLLVIRGSNITVDFTGVTLQGTAPETDPDRYTGVAVLVDGGSHVTIKNLTAHGYKIGILARKTTGLHITGSDLGYNWKPRLYSLVEHESLLDWMSYHHNEKDEWLDRGAGIYLADVDGGEIDRTTIVQGENGLMLARSAGLRIWNNTFSYLSGVGIGMYRSTGNSVVHNRVDYCVRGYSDGFYNRGQDSAGILMYEQSSKNIVAFNSVTHGGDGLFLWAGQTTMDTGEGGSNDNLFYDNDFSFAPTNGIEATFSRNTFIGNRIEGNWHGMWGGYSYDSDIVNNRFKGNVEGIAIEHGQDNRIEANTFDGDETAIRLWMNATQDPNWGYGRHRDTRSRDYYVAHNRFSGNKTGLKITKSEHVALRDNAFERAGTAMDVSDSSDVGPDATLAHFSIRDYELPTPVPGGMNAKVPEAERRGRDSIIVDEWGPYDWKSPKLWPAGRSDVFPLTLRVLGPPGAWKVASVRGATVAPSQGRVPGEITVTPSGNGIQDIDVRLTYTGAAAVSPRGVRVAAGKPYTFGYSRFFVPAGWNVRYYGFDAQAAPDTHADAFARVLSGEPVKTEHRDRLDFESGGPIADGVPRDRVALVAEGTVDLPAGAYEIRTISDDGIRVWVDDERVIDDWTPHESAIDRAPIAAGRHRIKVEYFELGGFAELRFDILRR